MGAGGGGRVIIFSRIGNSDKCRARFARPLLKTALKDDVSLHGVEIKVKIGTIAAMLYIVKKTDFSLSAVIKTFPLKEP